MRFVLPLRERWGITSPTPSLSFRYLISTLIYFLSLWKLLMLSSYLCLSGFRYVAFVCIFGLKMFSFSFYCLEWWFSPVWVLRFSLHRHSFFILEMWFYLLFERNCNEFYVLKKAISMFERVLFHVEKWFLVAIRDFRFSISVVRGMVGF